MPTIPIRKMTQAFERSKNSTQINQALPAVWVGIAALTPPYVITG